MWIECFLTMDLSFPHAMLCFKFWNKFWTLCLKEKWKLSYIIFTHINRLTPSFIDQYCSCYSVAKSCQTLWDPMDYSMPGFPVLHYLPGLLKLMSIKSLMTSNHLILCRHLLLPSVFHSIRIFTNESACHIRWPKY